MIDDHVLLALAETDAAAMPDGWSLQKAAKTISLQIATTIVLQQKIEPRVAGGEPYLVDS